jgi:hypothetical protein
MSSLKWKAMIIFSKWIAHLGFNQTCIFSYNKSRRSTATPPPPLKFPLVGELERRVAAGWWSVG